MQDVGRAPSLTARSGAGMTGGPPAGRKVGVIGVYGKGNLGDEALLLCIADDVRACLPGAEILAICSDPETVRRNLGFTAIRRSPRAGFIGKLRLIRSCRLLIVGGGTLLCDHNDFITDVKAMGSYFFWPMLARLFGVPTIAYAQGIGPATHGLVRRAIRRFLPMMADVTFRDSGSARLAQGLVDDGCRWPATCDPVVGAARFAPKRVSDAASGSVRAWLSTAGDYAVVALRYPKLATLEAHGEYLECAASAIAAFQARSGAHLVLFPAHVSERYQDDRTCIAYLERSLLAAGAQRDKVSVASWNELEDAAAILQKARVVVGDRLHALLLAAMNGVPLVGLAVEDKIGGCLAEIGNGRVCRVLEPARDDPDLIATAIVDAWFADLEERCDHRAAVARWQALHRQNIACLARHLANDTPRSGCHHVAVAQGSPPARALQSHALWIVSNGGCPRLAAMIARRRRRTVPGVATIADSA